MKNVFGRSTPYTFWFLGHLNIPDGRFSNFTFIYGEGLKLTFSCKFDLTDFPFDSHYCPMRYGDKRYSTQDVNLESSHVMFGNQVSIINGNPIILNDLPFPFKFELTPLLAYEISNNYGMKYSYTGMILKLERNSFESLLSTYYYPTCSFALLSMVSFLIKPEKVRILAFS